MPGNYTVLIVPFSFPFVNSEPGEYYSKWKAIEAMKQGKVAIIAGGTGNPYFTTDTGAALRDIEIDGVYTADPEKDPTATKFDEISYDEVLGRGLKVMDLTATALCKENNMPIYVFNMDVEGNLGKMLGGDNVGTLVTV